MAEIYIPEEHTVNYGPGFDRRSFEAGINLNKSVPKADPRKAENRCGNIYIDPSIINIGPGKKPIFNR